MGTRIRRLTAELRVRLANRGCVYQLMVNLVSEHRNELVKIHRSLLTSK